MLAKKQPIAIIGIGCKTPGNVNNHKELLGVLLKGIDGITDVPPERWNKDKFYDPDTNKTGGSASLVAIHLACQSIWLREAKQAITSGVNLNINPALGSSTFHG